MSDDGQNEQAAVGLSTPTAPPGYRSWRAYWSDLDRIHSAAVSSFPPPPGYSMWKEYWAEHGMPWRYMPEVDEERKAFLAKRRAIEPDIAQGIYPFKDIELRRADIEWMLVTHEAEDRIGPARWPPDDNEKEYRVGLDLRGANLAALDLSRLPLTRLVGGLDDELFPDATSEQRETAAMNLQGSNLTGCMLQDAELTAVRLQGALLLAADLQEANLNEAILDEADLSGSNLENAQLHGATLRHAILASTKAPFAFFGHAQLEQANFEHAVLTNAYFTEAQAKFVNFTEAQLQRAVLTEAQLSGAYLVSTHLEGADLSDACLAGASLIGAFLDATTKLNHLVLADSAYGTAQLSDVHWGDANVAVVDWSAVPNDVSSRLLHIWKSIQRPETGFYTRAVDAGLDFHQVDLDMLQAALRANRQLATLLRAHGINQDADRFAYRAQVLQRRVLGNQRKWGSFLGASILEVTCGYGYKPVRALATYTVILLGFMGLYLLNAHFAAPHLTWDEALVLSVSSFHGRGFFTQDITLGDTYARLAACEAVVGLLMEVTFIATFTQRFLGR